MVEFVFFSILYFSPPHKQQSIFLFTFVLLIVTLSRYINDLFEKNITIMFKESFKYYKSKWPVPDLTNVIDFRADNNKEEKVVCY